jgi:hypothetical protein
LKIHTRYPCLHKGDPLKNKFARFLGVTFSISPQAFQLPAILGSTNFKASAVQKFLNGKFFGKGGLLKTFSVFFLSAVCSFAQANVPLGTAINFGVLAGSTVTNTGTTPITGSVGVYPGTSITGFPPGTVTDGAIHAGDMIAAAAQSDLTTAYLDASGQMPTQVLTGMNLGGLTLPPGVYFFSSSAQLTGTLTLTGAGFYIFQIGSTLTTASNSKVRTINGAQAANVFWQVGSSATLGTGTTFIGNILAMASITANTGVILGGRLLARTGAVTLQSVTLNYPPAIPTGSPGGPPPPPATPAPSSWILVLIGLACAVLFQTRERWLRRLKNS